MPGLMSAKTETQLWQDLIQTQQDYARSLARLDALAIDVIVRDPPYLDRRLVEEAAETRRAAYSKYRCAMDELAKFNRK
jgi:hypothetical protein